MWQHLFSVFVVSGKERACKGSVKSLTAAEFPHVGGGVGNETAKRTCQNLDPDLPPWNAYKTDISVIARPTFNLPHSVTICLSSTLDMPCIRMCHTLLCFSPRSQRTHGTHWEDRWPCCWTGRTVVIMIADPVYKLSDWSSADPKRGPGNVYSGYSTSPLHGETERKRGRGTANTNERWQEWCILCVSLQFVFGVLCTILYCTELFNSCLFLWKIADILILNMVTLKGWMFNLRFQSRQTLWKEIK